jgi:SAM-dependent methyltransferase
MEEKRKTARDFARQYIGKNDPLGWFDALYEKSGGEPGIIPWADMAPSPNLIQWLETHKTAGTQPSALEIGCGLGDNAEELARRGFSVTAFDISETAVQWAMKRFPQSPVSYEVQDLFQPSASWRHGFDLVLESYTLQVLPPELRTRAIEAISRFVAPGGTLLVICRGREPEEDSGKMPWPLTKRELTSFKEFGLDEVTFEDFLDAEEPPVRRFRVTYHRPYETP